MRHSSGPLMAQRLSQPGRDAAAELSQLLCRVRPCEKPSPLVVLHDDEAKLEVALETNSSQSQGADRTTTLNFDKIFHEDQQELFVQLQPAIISCIGGASCTVVAHGGQQSGKSYALSGLFTSGETHGLAPRAVQAITEEIERMTGPVPSVEASFFELQQDAVCDLLSASAPRVAMRETTQPPFVALDPHLTAMKCDGASGFNRLLDAYFTGLEHRRKGNHTCFQAPGPQHVQEFHGRKPTFLAVAVFSQSQKTAPRPRSRWITLCEKTGKAMGCSSSTQSQSDFKPFKPELDKQGTSMSMATTATPRNSTKSTRTSTASKTSIRASTGTVQSLPPSRRVTCNETPRLTFTKVDSDGTIRRSVTFKDPTEKESHEQEVGECLQRFVELVETHPEILVKKVSRKRERDWAHGRTSL
eukprot:symbB.v1.2.005623.t1/scaffold309.1/size276354/4